MAEVCWKGLQFTKLSLSFLCVFTNGMTLGRSFHFSEAQFPQLQNGSLTTSAYNMPAMVFSAEVEHRFIGDN